MSEESTDRLAVAATPPLSRRLAALPEPAMRAATLAHVLSAATPEIAVRLLDALILEARAGDKAALAGYASLVDPRTVGASIPAERRAQLVLVADSEACSLAAQWLETVPEEENEAPDRDTTKFVHRDLRKLTLGHRRALARQARGDGLKKLLMDPDPMVIENLLNNSQTTEEVVVSICARRPTVPPPLLCVLHAPRWIQRYKVKLALVSNPEFPVRFGINLLVYLNAIDLTRVRDDGTLAQRLRLAAKRLLEVGRRG